MSRMVGGVLLCVGLIATGLSAYAVEKTAWFPYANVNRWGSSSAYTCPWGYNDDPDGNNQPYGIFRNWSTAGQAAANSNYIWNGNHIKRWFEARLSEDSLINWAISIRNTSDVNFTGSNALVLRMYQANGQQVTSSTQWDNLTSEPNHDLLRDDLSVDGVVFDSNLNVFKIDLAVGQTVTIPAIVPDNGGANRATTVSLIDDMYIFNSSGSYQKPLHLSVTQPNGYSFVATMEGGGLKCVPRASTSTTFTTAFPTGQSLHKWFNFKWRYAGVFENEYTGTGTQTVYMPRFTEKWVENGDALEFGTFVFVVNTASATDTITIATDSITTSKTPHQVSLASHARFNFLPSQACLDSAATTYKGSIAISGARPVAVALEFQYAKPGFAWTDGTEYEQGRTYSVDALPFAIKR